MRTDLNKCRSCNGPFTPRGSLCGTCERGTTSARRARHGLKHAADTAVHAIVDAAALSQPGAHHRLHGAPTADEVAELAGSWEGADRAKAAAFGSPDLLRSLANDPEPRVREVVASNEDTDPGTVSALRRDPVATVRAAAVAHPAATEQSVLSAVDDQDWEVRVAACRPSLPHDERQRLLHDPVPQVQQAARAAGLHIPRPPLPDVPPERRRGIFRRRG